MKTTISLIFLSRLGVGVEEVLGSVALQWALAVDNLTFFFQDALRFVLGIALFYLNLS